MIPLLYLALVPPLWATTPVGSGSTGDSGDTGTAGTTSGSGDTGTAGTAGTTGAPTGPDTGTTPDTGTAPTTPGGSGAQAVGVSAAELAGEVGGCHCDAQGSPLSSSWLLLLWMLRRKLR